MHDGSLREHPVTPEATLEQATVVYRAPTPAALMAEDEDEVQRAQA
jgi:hypothetical protein